MHFGGSAKMAGRMRIALSANTLDIRRNCRHNHMLGRKMKIRLAEKSEAEAISGDTDMDRAVT